MSPRSPTITSPRRCRRSGSSPSGPTSSASTARAGGSSTAPAKGWITHLHQLQVVLYHRGQLDTQPRKLMPARQQPLALAPRMQTVAERWLAARRLTDAPATVEKLELALRMFAAWLKRTIRRSPRSRRSRASTAWSGSPTSPTAPTADDRQAAGGDVPDPADLGTLAVLPRHRPVAVPRRARATRLIGAGDAPKYPQKVPRFIPEHELEQLMPVIDAIACPFQRAALLVARWSGARRDEIRRLPLDCLDRYPDGTARLRLSGRKTYKERVVPLHQDAAAALQQVIDLRKDAPERPFTDERTGEEIRYLFMSHGKLLSTHYLFDSRSSRPARPSGLVRPGGARRHRTGHRHRPPLPPHRRHPARRARREAAHDHESPRPHVGQHGARLRADQRPTSAARLPGSARTRSDDRRASRPRAPKRRLSPTPRSTG